MYLSVIGKLNCQDLNENKKALIEDGARSVVYPTSHPLRTVLFYHIPEGIQMYYLKRKTRLTNSQRGGSRSVRQGDYTNCYQQIKYRSSIGILLKIAL